MSRSKSLLLPALLGAVALVLIVGLAYWLFNKEKPATQQTEPLVEVPEPQVQISSPVAVAEEPLTVVESSEVLAPQEPEPTSEPEPVLPSLNSSDDDLKGSILKFDGGKALLDLLVNDQLIRKAVRMVHGISEGFVVKEYRPITSPSGRFQTDELGDTAIDGQKYYVMSEKNIDRYVPYMSLMSVVEPKVAAELYDKYHPLLQQAYEELGLKDAYFHEVTLSALDELLKPTISNESLKLRRPSVMYIYDDKRIETTSGVNKLKLRLGVKQTEKMQAWLTELRTELERLPL